MRARLAVRAQPGVKSMDKKITEKQAAEKVAEQRERQKKLLKLKTNIKAGWCAWPVNS